MSRRRDKNPWCRGTGLTQEQFDEYEEVFDLMDKLKDTTNGGMIKELVLFFALRDTEANRQQLEDMWGNEWRSKFVRVARGKAGASSLPTLDTKMKEEDTYAWMAKKSVWEELTPAQASVLVQGFDTTTGTLKLKCIWDKVVAIILVLVATIHGGPSAGAAMWMAWIAAAVSIVSIISGKPISKNMSIALAVMTMGTDMASGLAGSVIHQVVQVAMLAIQIRGAHDQDKFAEAMKKERDEQDRIGNEIESMVRESEAQMKFMFNDMYDVNQREGIEKDPYSYIRDTYERYTVYPEIGRDGTWEQVS